MWHFEKGVVTFVGTLPLMQQVVNTIITHHCNELKIMIIIIN